MSNKEERLVLAIIPANERSETCPFCSTGEFWDMCSLYDKDGEANCNKCQAGLTRAEAVERMAKVVFQKDNVLSLDIGFDKLEQRKKNFYLELAEAALDALIGDIQA